MDRRTLGWLLFLSSVTWHLWWVFAPPDAGGGPVKRTLGRDFASYHYAAVVASRGGDPWDADALSAAARADGTRDVVHPFFYPAPALLTVAWAPTTDLRTGYAVWYWLQELCVLLCGLVLWRWWRSLGGLVPVAIATWIAWTWAIPYGLVMGQINPLVLLLLLAGLWQTDDDRPWLGGALVGAAAMIKMSPAIVVLWWALHQRWRAVGGAVACAVGLTLATLPLVGPAEQLRFATEILPAFSTGDYNGLVVKIGMFANHSLPNLLDQAFPGDGTTLSVPARLFTVAVTLLVLGGLALAFQRRPRTRWQTAGQGMALLVFALLVPVYTYEHHLFQALPAGVLLTVAIAEGKLSKGWLPVLGLAAVGLAWPHSDLKAVARELPALAWGLQELKTGGLLGLLAAMARLGMAKGRR